MSVLYMKTSPVAYDIQNSTIFGHGWIDTLELGTMEMKIAEMLSAHYQTVIMSMIGSIVVGLSGLFPLLVLPVDDTISLKTGSGKKNLRLLLSFSVGGMLGDVFLHVLPEVWSDVSNKNKYKDWSHDGWWVLIGLLVFIVAEKLFSLSDDEADDNNDDTIIINNSVAITNVNNNHKDLASIEKLNNKLVEKEKQIIKISGYLNLLANCIDNFTHGLALGGSFLISPRVGLFTTLAILVHEIPHEVGDFAILLKSGFTRWQAACAQTYTASAGMLGALTAIYCSGISDDVEAKTSWIMPFTAGGFLHISLVTVLPELVTEENVKESIKQFTLIIFGICVMFVMSSLFE
ncbi:zinc transporter ZIP13 homolog [Daktulosphaira vitifoliae]|uniref:zinc transporter ZIP13 homolog n=1 Tax=Daktulosphaira vitifoliae TaxID=58002 RepID=UPI0021AA989A|nr:zinc transporter ZIP13 homolog [Daktulosphaira vitifoliae]XP_050534780.1 zinc transporter ZIP13 homolog [Daktulosphaira vitifoliae]